MTFSGEMAEWSKAAVLKTAVGSAYRGFESHSLRHFFAPIRFFKSESVCAAISKTR